MESRGHAKLDVTRRDGSRERQRGGYWVEGGVMDDGLWMVGGGGRKISTTRRGMMKRRVRRWRGKERAHMTSRALSQKSQLE